MTPNALTTQQRLVLACTPHMQQLLDALNPHGALRVHDLNLDHSTARVLDAECRVSGLDPAEALAWVEAHSDGPMLRVHSPTIRMPACTLWFGKVGFHQLPPAYVRLEVPLATRTQTKAHESVLVLTIDVDANAQALDQWAANERERLAEDGVERYLRPVLLQSEAFGFEAVALGLRTAMLRLAPTKVAGLLACTVPVLMSGWIRAWAQALAVSNPLLRRIEAEFGIEFADRETPTGPPSVGRLHLIGSHGESMWVHPSESETYWEQDEQDAKLVRLRALTGAELQTPEAVVSFLEELAGLMLTQYRAQGATEIELPIAFASGDPGHMPQAD